MGVATSSVITNRIGVDTGGTFTDFVWIDSNGVLKIHKELSTPTDPSEAVLKGMHDMGVGTEVDVIHGSTVATNALLERKGAKTALITTAGFGDVLAIGRQSRPDLYALVPRKPDPLVPEDLRFEVHERVNSNAEIVKALEVDELRPIWELITAAHVESIAVCLLFSFLRPEHERTIAKELDRLASEQSADSLAQKGIKLFISLSSDVLPEFREYERTSTTVINAYVVPIMDRYLRSLADGLRPRRLSIMQSNGGIASASAAASQAARTVLSGPAGGVVGARTIANLAGFPDIITFDMGGTSTDVALCEAQLPLTGEGEIAGQPLRLPMIDIHTVGSGGGSIARIDAGGALIVGPESAGADPGPACYPRRLDDKISPTRADTALKATTTDANLVLGRLDADHFLGGAMTLDSERAAETVSGIARGIGRSSIHNAAWDIIRVANATMERAIRKISVERGHDPRRFTLVAFGGAGPLHACDLAEGLNIPRVLVPTSPGVLSAAGMLAAAPTRDLSKTIMVELNDHETIESKRLHEEFRILEKRAVNDFVEDGYELGNLIVSRALDMRYVGQSHELRVNIDASAAAMELNQLFHEVHQRRYGYRQEGTGVEIVHLRLSVVANIAEPSPTRPEKGSSNSGQAEIGEKTVWFSKGFTKTVLYDRAKLLADNEIPGPAIIFQYDTTTVIPPDWIARVDQAANLLISR